MDQRALDGVMLRSADGAAYPIEERTGGFSLDRSGQIRFTVGDDELRECSGRRHDASTNRVVDSVHGARYTMRHLRGTSRLSR